jgi:UDPglucose--hexose-1-phosphate uridylyltransferase
LKIAEDPHRRFNPLTGEWVLVSPHRASRPWQGQVEKLTTVAELQYDPTCYLCPGNERAGGAKNPVYNGTYVFENDFAALKPGLQRHRVDVKTKGLLVVEAEPGICRVMCFSPRHDLNLASMQPQDTKRVVREWAAQYRELGAIPDINHVQIFENRGASMGASNPHPHCQIWSTGSIPEIPAKELAAQQEYLRNQASCLLCDYMQLEKEQKLRVIHENDGFVILVPFWAIWPFEVLLCGRRHFGSFLDFTDQEFALLSESLQRLISIYDKIFDVPFPYSMGFHQSPTDGHLHPEWHFHAHFYPPLLRSATVRKFMVGFEMLGTPQRDITPEQAAERLRSLNSAFESQG